MPSAMKKSIAPPVTSSAEKGKKKNKVCRYQDIKIMMHRKLISVIHTFTQGPKNDKPMKAKEVEKKSKISRTISETNKV